MSAEVNRDVAASDVGCRYKAVGGEGVGQVFVGRGFGTEQRQAVAPGRVDEAVRIQRGDEVSAAGIVPAPEVGRGNEFDNLGGNIGHNGDPAVWKRIWAAGSRLNEAHQCVTTARAAALRDVRPLRAIDNYVNGIEQRIRKDDDAAIRIELEVQMIRALARVPVRRKGHITAAGNEAQGRNRIQCGGSLGVRQETTS